MDKKQSGKNNKKYFNQNILGLVSLFNGISTFVRCLMLKPFLQKNINGMI